MVISKTLLRKSRFIAALSSVIIPGLFRIVFLGLVARVASGVVANEAISLYTFATGLCVFTSLGFSVDLMRVTGGVSDENGDASRGNIAAYNQRMIGVTIFSILASYIVGYRLTDEFTLLLISLGIFQLERHWYLGQGELIELVYIDVGCLILALILFTVGISPINSLVLSNLCIAIFSIIYSKGLNSLLRFPSINFVVYRDGLILGLNNLASSGLMFLLPTLVYDQGVSDSKTFSLVVAVAGLCMIGSRAKFNQEFKALIGDIRFNKRNWELYRNVVENVNRVTALMTPVAVLGIYFYLYISRVHIGTFTALDHLTIWGLIFFLAIGQFSLVDANILVMRGREKLSIVSNLSILAMVLICAFILKFAHVLPAYRGVLLILILCVLFILRAVVYSRDVSIYYLSEESNKPAFDLRANI